MNILNAVILVVLTAGLLWLQSFWAVLAIYIIGFCFTFWVNLQIGPVMPSLAFIRALVWPYFWITGGPDGSSARMD